MCFNLSLLYLVIPGLYLGKIVQIVEAVEIVEIAIQIAAACPPSLSLRRGGRESRSHRIISEL